MVRTIIIPSQTDIRLSIPEKYIGKKVEITFFALDELMEKQSKKTMGDFLGLLKDSSSTYSNVIETHLASEYVLAKDWLNQKEDEAWKDL